MVAKAKAAPKVPATTTTPAEALVVAIDAAAGKPSAVPSIDIDAALQAFSDLPRRLADIGAKALDRTLVEYRDTYWPIVDSARRASDAEPATAVQLTERFKIAAESHDPPRRWSLTVAQLRDVIKLQATHTAARLALYEADCAETAVDEGKPVRVSMAGYTRFIGEMESKARDADGKLTADELAKRTARVASDAKLAETRVPMGATDFMLDIAGLPATDQYRALLRFQINLKLDLEEVGKLLTSDARRNCEREVTAQHKEAAGLATVAPVVVTES